jgi:hypothetical protein
MSYFYYVKLDAYYNRTRYPYSVNILKDFVEIIKENYKNNQFSILENLYESRLLKIFFDIENIPSDQPNLIYKIIDEIFDFFQFDNRKYALTLNKNSRHPGLSYHLYFPYTSYLSNMNNMVHSLCYNKPHITNYIDTSVYANNRLFRVVGACDLIDKKTEKRNLESYHELIKGNIEDSIIQNTFGLKEYISERNFNDYRKSSEYLEKLKTKNVSGGGTDNIENKLSKLIYIVKETIQKIEEHKKEPDEVKIFDRHNFDLNRKIQKLEKLVKQLQITASE